MTCENANYPALAITPTWGERYEGVWCGVAGVFVGADDCEKGTGEHGEGDPPAPGHPPPHLVFVQSGLGVFDAARGTGVLALHAHGVGALLQVAGLVDDQYRILITEMLHDVSAQVVADRVRVPLGPGQQVLQAVRAGVSGMLSDRPAILLWQVGQQSQDEGSCAASRFDPHESARDPTHQGIEYAPPSRGVYAMACGHRLIFVCPHNTR